jgi:hypothetical protein
VLAITGTELSLDYVLDYTEIRADTVMGWTISFCWVLNALVATALMVLIVPLHVFHLLCTSYYSRHIPSTFLWWILNIFSCVVMTLTAEWACMKREMEPIMVNARNEDDEGNVDTGRKRKTSDHGVVASVVDKGKQMLEDATGKGKGKYETISMEEIGDSSHS